MLECMHAEHLRPTQRFSSRNAFCHMQLCNKAFHRTALQAHFRAPVAAMCGTSKGNGSTNLLDWSSSPAAQGKYAKELDTACLAVQLASKLCRTVQQQLQSSETAGKQDDSPVTVADYGGCINTCRPPLLLHVCSLREEQCTTGGHTRAVSTRKCRVLQGSIVPCCLS